MLKGLFKIKSAYFLISQQVLKKIRHFERNLYSSVNKVFFLRKIAGFAYDCFLFRILFFSLEPTEKSFSYRAANQKVKIKSSLFLFLCIKNISQT